MLLLLTTAVVFWGVNTILDVMGNFPKRMNISWFNVDPSPISLSNVELVPSSELSSRSNVDPLRVDIRVNVETYDVGVVRLDVKSVIWDVTLSLRDVRPLLWLDVERRDVESIESVASSDAVVWTDSLGLTSMLAEVISSETKFGLVCDIDFSVPSTVSVSLE